jgi:hypothetical protein
MAKLVAREKRLDQPILVNFTERDRAQIQRVADSDERFNGQMSSVIRHAVKEYLHLTDETW